MRRFHFSSSRADLIIELTKHPRQLLATLDFLHDQAYTGQILVDFHRGQPKHVAFPEVHRIPLAQPGKS